MVIKIGTRIQSQAGYINKLLVIITRNYRESTQFPPGLIFLGTISNNINYLLHVYHVSGINRTKNTSIVQLYNYFVPQVRHEHKEGWTIEKKKRQNNTNCIPNNVEVLKMVQGRASKRDWCWTKHTSFLIKVGFPDSFIITKVSPVLQER